MQGFLIFALHQHYPRYYWDKLTFEGFLQQSCYGETFDFPLCLYQVESLPEFAC